MELTNEFVVPIAVDEAWKLLTDVERIAPCMPGAELQEIDGAEYRGIVKVKVGPITAQYKGKATFVEKDDAAHKAVLRAEGRDTRGQGNANATITATLEAAGDGTRVKVVTDLAITGRAAQFGRGVMADVSTKLLGQFVTCLEKNVLGAGAAPEAPRPHRGPPSRRRPRWAPAGRQRRASAGLPPHPSPASRVEPATRPWWARPAGSTARGPTRTPSPPARGRSCFGRRSPSTSSARRAHPFSSGCCRR